MLDLLHESVVRIQRQGGASERLSLPGVYQAMIRDDVAGFPALRPHQRHAWHAFLAQLGVVALAEAGCAELPEDADAWRDLLTGLTRERGGDEAWNLVVADCSRPAFMQCPEPDGLADYRKVTATPDDLDLLVTAKNHAVKTSQAVGGQVDDWLFALVNLQTMSGFGGAGNYGIARMNGGYSSRPCLGLAPRDGGIGAHLRHDIEHMLARRDELLEGYPDYFKPEGGASLLWLYPWDGTSSLSLTALDPYFIEICRRVRLIERAGRITALGATSRKPRIAAKPARGDVGDHWMPVSSDGKALSVKQTGFRYDTLHKLLLDEGYQRPASMRANARGGQWRLVARAVAGGRGKTEGYHERTDIVFGPRVARAFLSSGPARDDLAELAERQIAEIKEVSSALGLAVAVAASGGKAASPSRSDREHAYPYRRRLDVIADGRFFHTLQERFEASGEARTAVRRKFAQGLIGDAQDLVREAVETVPCTNIHRHRARARAESAFWGRLRRTASVFSDQEDIFHPPTEDTPRG